MKIVKREGYMEEYNPDKIENAIRRVFEETNSKPSEPMIEDIITSID